MADATRPCPVCKQGTPRRFCVHKESEFVRCGSCGCLYQRVPPDAGYLSEVYRGDYHVRRGHSGDAALEAVKAATTRHYLRILLRSGVSGRRLLEVGCSAGASLAAAAEDGWEAHGVEVSPEAAAVARSRPDVTSVHTGTIADAPFASGSFDAILFFDVIEHIDPPQPALEAVARLLRPGGLVLMVTPDAGSWSLSLMRSRWPHLFIEHVIVYSRKALAATISAAGLHVARIGFAWKEVNLDMLVRHATLHRHIRFGSLVRLLGRLTPARLQRLRFPFNVGEFYILARRRP
jgi:SAM-dependent methyltransferase